MIIITNFLAGDLNVFNLMLLNFIDIASPRVPLTMHTAPNTLCPFGNKPQIH